jgi:Purple acid Phosphatase, N-terminal domain
MRYRRSRCPPTNGTSCLGHDGQPRGGRNGACTIEAAAEGPTLESFRNNEAIITWTSNNPGGADEHFGVVSYGTDRNQLNQMAKSPIRLNRNHPYTVFRVRVEGLKPGITYYYTVDSMGGDGTRDGVESTVYHFTTPADLPEP